MKVGRMLGERFKEAPKDCVIASHALMMRGGYMKYVGNGIYSLFTPAKRITSKIEKIIREEMDRIDGEEVLFPVVMPATLWQQSGRIESVGSELVRLKDRNGNDMVLGMTHEEAAVHLARDTAKSYADFPFMIYQIQTKFRDEPRARGGLIRVREFTMKDAYSFHTSQADLEQYYQRCYEAYERIFRRAGAKHVIAVKSDSGMMGGSVSHEFMLLSEIGEDTLAICPECGYKANMEAAECIVNNERDDISEELKLVHTPNIQSIEDVCDFLNMPKEKSCKDICCRSWRRKISRRCWMSLQADGSRHCLQISLPRRYLIPMSTRSACRRYCGRSQKIPILRSKGHFAMKVTYSQRPVKRSSSISLPDCWMGGFLIRKYR